MPLAEFLEDPKPAISKKDTPVSLDPAAKLRKKVFLQSGAMIAVGLALTGWYVGYRIFAGRAAALRPMVAVTVERAQPSAPAPAAVPTGIPDQVSAPLSAPAPPAADELEAPAVKSFPTTGPMPPVVTAPAKHLNPATSAKSSPTTGPIPPAAAVPAKPVNPATSAKSSPANGPIPPAAPAAAKPDNSATSAKPSTAVNKPLVAPAILEATRTVQPAKRKDSSAVPFTRREAAPRTGEKYLQIAAFGPHALDGYLKTLEAQGLRPVVAPGPVDNIYRILIGPLPSAAVFEETRRLIQASGIEPIVRVY